ncbi:hypothetical protein AB9X01_004690, partial [Salmonella enterica]
AANEAYDDEYTSTEGDVYDPVRLTTERVFDDIPLAEITPLLVDDASGGKMTTQDWILEQLDSAGGRISREELKTLWIEEDRKEATLRQGIRRLIKQNDIAETPDGFITDTLRGAPVTDFDGVKLV